MIHYVSPEETEKNIRRYNLESRLRRLEKKFHQSKKPTVMDELLALAKKYHHLTN
jgi:hypothetical protein